MNVTQLLSLAILVVGLGCGRARVVDDPIDAGVDAQDAPSDTSDD